MKNHSIALGLIIGVLVCCSHARAELSELRAGGFFSQGFLRSDRYDYIAETSDGSFEFREAAARLSLSPFSHTTLSGQVFAFQLGENGEFEPKVDFLYADHQWREYLGFRVGRIRRPEGLFNEVLDLDATRTFVLLPVGVYQLQLRDVISAVDGASLYGRLKFGSHATFDYQLFGGDVPTPDDSSLSQIYQRTFRQTFGSIEDFSFKLANVWGTHLAFSTSNGLRLGYSRSLFSGLEASANAPALGGRRIVTPLEVERSFVFAEYFWQKFAFRAEYLYGSETIEGIRIGGVEQPGSRSKTSIDGWYISAEYFHNRRFALGTYYSEHFVNWGDGNSSRARNPEGVSRDRTRNLAFSIRYNPFDWWILKFEVHAFRGTSVIPPLQPFDQDFSQSEWFMLAAKTTFVF